MDKIKEFHTSRIMFYVWNGEVVMAPENDPRSHKEWINNAYIYNACVRGYYTPGKIVVYTGGDAFATVERRGLVQNYLVPVLDSLGAPEKHVEIHNGVVKGKVGNIWEPVYKSLLIRLNRSSTGRESHETSIRQNDKHSKEQIKSIW